MVRAVILSDRSLREAIEAGRIVIDPFDPDLVQPSSIDVRVDRLFRVFRNHTAGVIDVKQDLTDLTELVEIDERRRVHAPPGRVRARLDARAGRRPRRPRRPRRGEVSSLGRLGLLIHSTAGFVDAGFDGHITLELANVASLPITLYPGMKIGQVSFMQMTTPAERPYGKGATGSKYQGQRGPDAEPLLRELQPVVAGRAPTRSSSSRAVRARGGLGPPPSSSAFSNTPGRPKTSTARAFRRRCPGSGGSWSGSRSALAASA